MFRIFQPIIRISAFLGKEIAEVLRQPKLILTLILGPFIILLLFGVGYRNEPRPVRTLFVADPNSPLGKQIQQYAATISPQLIYAGITPDKNVALSDLQNGKYDLVAVAPSNAFETIQNNKQAVFSLYFNEIDPAQAGYIQYLGQIYVDEVNRRVLSTLAQQGQSQATDIQKQLQNAKNNAQAMRQALQSGDTQTALSTQQQLRSNVADLAVIIGTRAGLLAGVQQNVGSGGSETNNQDMIGLLNDLQKQSNIPPTGTQVSNLDKAIADIDQLNQQLSSFQQISPDVLVRPFTVTSTSVSKVNITALDFFTPSVIVLLLQHIAITIAALSIVRERRSGAMEIFRVSPVSSLETMIGKYLSYLIFGGAIAAILTGLIFLGLHIPMLGSWLNYAWVSFALLFAALGVGFVISILAETESQAVQLAMIALLLSVFFSGFILDLRYFWPPVRAISYIIPATHAIILLQNIMLRGNQILPVDMAALLGLGIIMFFLAWILLRRLMARR